MNENTGMVATYQSGCRKGKTTVGPVVRPEDEVRKAQVYKYTVDVVFFDVKKAYDMLLIKLHLMEIGGKMFYWVMDLDGRSIEVKIGSELSSQYVVENRNTSGEWS